MESQLRQINGDTAFDSMGYLISPTWVPRMADVQTTWILIYYS